MRVKLSNNRVPPIRSLISYPSICTHFGLVHPISKRRTITLIDGSSNPGTTSYILHTCREVINSTIRKIRAGMCNGSTKFDKVRLLVFYRDSKNKHRCDKTDVLKVLNCIEKEKGWKITRVHKVDMDMPEAERVYTDSFLFVGPKQWVASPYMMGIYMLLIRSILKFSTTPNRMIVFDDIDTLIKGIYENSGRSKDISKLNNKDKGWNMIVDNYKPLHVGGESTCWFENGKKDELVQNVYNMFSDGPDSLIAGCSHNKVIQKSFNKLTYQQITL